MTSSQGGPGSILDTSHESKKTTQDHGTSECRLSEVTILVQISRCWRKLAGVSIDPGRNKSPASFHRYPRRKKHLGNNRECFIWTRFADWKSDDKGSGPQMLEDHSTW